MRALSKISKLINTITRTKVEQI